MKLTITEAVAAIPVSERTLRRAIDSGKIGFTRNEKGRRFFDSTELERVFGSEDSSGEKISDEFARYDMLRLQSSRHGISLRLEGVAFNSEGEEIKADVIESFDSTHEACAYFFEVTSASNWIDIQPRDDDLLHSPEEYQRLNMSRYSDLKVFKRRRISDESHIFAVTCDSTGQITRRKFLSEFDTRERALKFARALTGKDEIEVIPAQ